MLSVLCTTCSRFSSLYSVNCTSGKPLRPSNTVLPMIVTDIFLLPDGFELALRSPSRLLFSLNSSVPCATSGKWISVTLVFLTAPQEICLVFSMSTDVHSVVLHSTVSWCHSTRGGCEGWPVWNLADKADLTICSICVRLWNCAEQLVYRSKVGVEWWSVLWWLSKLCLCRVIYNLNVNCCLGYCFQNISVILLHILAAEPGILGID